MKIKSNCRDSVFVSMFGEEDKKYLLDLYKALHPEDKDVTVDDLDNVSIENVLVNDIYNDLGFTVKNRLIVLVEAQTTWSPNILIRMLIYIGKSYQDYIYSHEEIKNNLYGKSKIVAPTPELYVLFAGEKGKNKRILSLQEDFFESTDSNIDIKVKVIYADDNRSDIIGQYLTFCMVYKEQLQKYKADKSPENKIKAIRETIKICKEKDVLREFLTQHEREVQEVMFGLFTQEELTEAFGNSRYNEGVSQQIDHTILKMLELHKSYEEIAEVNEVSVDYVKQIENEMLAK